MINLLESLWRRLDSNLQPPDLQFRITCSFYIFIDGPTNIRLLPAQKSYRQNESSFLAPVRCMSDCWQCEYTWTGPQAQPAGAQLSLSTLQRREDGDYTCTARNIRTNFKLTTSVTVEVRCKRTSMLYIMLYEIYVICRITCCENSCLTTSSLLWAYPIGGLSGVCLSICRP